jgi:hypothetical protein
MPAPGLQFLCELPGLDCRTHRIQFQRRDGVMKQDDRLPSEAPRHPARGPPRQFSQHAYACSFTTRAVISIWYCGSCSSSSARLSS